MTADPPLRLLPFEVSVLFSEPKIPQSDEWVERCVLYRTGFSALQRAENSSIVVGRGADRRNTQFQCSSASRKFLNREDLDAAHPRS